eukprot:CAMPEP_0174827686 /NCGR_PEP_ID=MMETSP1114-20130205/875_1 /TAXON_ID=312471 /ORGANISM="Neobodo designis, Strain CCAP 1951/1" /LENGTH=471 /DNA_ID=CAMNT_0016061361 /DNA_START=41 /DNA_END=1454 /DNA_ORIENTATION=-
MPRGGDVLPEMPAAGKAGVTAANSSSLAETMTGYKAPPTPDRLRPFRQSGRGPVGAGSSHYAKGDAFHVPDSRFGRKNRYDESTATRFQEMKEPVFQPKTREYASEVKEPLGKSMTYGFKIPEHMQGAEFKYGKPTNTSEPVKTVMYPPEGPGAVAPKNEPMAQTQRGYDWAKVQIDPTEFRFGAVAKRGKEEPFNPTQLVPLATTQQRYQNGGEVGRPRKAGYAPPTDPNHTFGMTTGKGESMAQALMQTGETPADLGKSTIKSATLRKLRDADRASKPGDDSRCFGMPSVRSDKPPPAAPKITGNTNFGDEPSANQLLFPTPDTTAGASKALACVDDAEVLANRCKFGLTRSEVERAYGHAARQAVPVTVASFKRAVDDLDLYRRRKKPRTMCNSSAARTKYLPHVAAVLRLTPACGHHPRSRRTLPSSGGSHRRIVNYHSDAIHGSVVAGPGALRFCTLPFGAFSKKK